MAIKNYSTTAGNNNSAPPNGAPEGMAPSLVNDVIRQVMADIRSQFESGEWFDYGVTPTWVSSASFSITGDASGQFTVGRPVEIYGATMGTAYSQVKSSTYVNPTTTITLNHSAVGSSISQVRTSLLKNSNGIPRALANDFSISGALAISGGLTVTGNITSVGAMSVGTGLDVQGNVSIGGALVINGLINNTATFSNKVQSTKSAVSGFIRITPNFCYTNTTASYSTLSSGNNSITAPSGSTYVLAHIVAYAKAIGGPGSRQSRVDIYDSGFTKLYAYAVDAEAYEEGTVTAAISQTLASDTNNAICPVSSGLFYLKANYDLGGSSVASYVISGYYD